MLRCPMMIKFASPKWVKMIRSNKLSDKAMKMLLGAGYKERYVKHIGVGSGRISDLVFKNKHGLVVRKIPRIETLADSSIPGQLKRQVREHSSWNTVRKSMKSNGINVTKMVEQKGPAAYYEYAKGSPRVRKPGELAIPLHKYKALKKKHPFLRDITNRNMVGNTLVDFDATTPLVAKYDMNKIRANGNLNDIFKIKNNKRISDSYKAYAQKYKDKL